MKDYKYYFFLLLFLISFSSFAGPGTLYNRIVFFGDSLTDNGNLYNYDYGYLPKSPPYFQGRFTNGYVWSEKVAKHFYNEYLASSNNYALGGQTAVFHGASDKYLPVTISMSVSTYLWRTSWADRSKTLYIIWIGANDYLRGVNNEENATDEVISSIKSNIEKLIYYGGNNFIIMNIPDLSKTPAGLTSEYHEQLAILSAMHNKKLKEAIDAIENGDKTINIKLFDANFYFDELLKNAGSDTLPDVHFTNTTQGCWQGGYTYKRNTQKQNIHDDLQNYIQTHQKYFNGSKGKNFDAEKFEYALLNSPDLREAYRVTKLAEQGIERPCRNPQNYIFWDKLHPTAIVHKMLARRMVLFIKENFEAED